MEECNQHTDILGYQHSYGDTHSGKVTICYGNWESRFFFLKQIMGNHPAKWVMAS